MEGHFVSVYTEANSSTAILHDFSLGTSVKTSRDNVVKSLDDMMSTVFTLKRKVDVDLQMLDSPEYHRQGGGKELANAPPVIQQRCARGLLRALTLIQS